MSENTINLILLIPVSGQYRIRIGRSVPLSKIYRTGVVRFQVLDVDRRGIRIFAGRSS
jgi:hypothetical protein